MNNFDVLVDSDAFVGWIVADDAHHEVASQIFDRMIKENKNIVTTSATIAETVTVLSYLVGQEPARQFLNGFLKEQRFPYIFIDEKLHQDALHIFSQQKRRGTSFNDCANVAVMQHFAIPYILSFDKVYQKDFELPVLAFEPSSKS